MFDRTDMKRYIFILLAMCACAYEPEQPEEQTLEDLERAIQAIEDRREAEYRIIEEQEKIISILDQNIASAKSEGMKRKIRKDITEKEVIIGKAETNLENQEEILNELYAKRDSLKEAEK